jgi:hypothetical protein
MGSVVAQLASNTGNHTDNQGNDPQNDHNQEHNGQNVNISGDLHHAEKTTNHEKISFQMDVSD